jgi:hypothetical protein
MNAVAEKLNRNSAAAAEVGVTPAVIFYEVQ